MTNPDDKNMTELLMSLANTSRKLSDTYKKIGDKNTDPTIAKITETERREWEYIADLLEQKAKRMGTGG